MTLATRLKTMFKGNRVGEDRLGNVYYTDKKGKRWVIYANKSYDASAVCPEWHAWLHHAVDNPLEHNARKTWQKDYIANQTGSADAYIPPSMQNGAPEARGYSAWKPGATPQD